MHSKFTSSLNKPSMVKFERGAVLFFTMAMMFIIVLVSVGVSESTNYQQKIFAYGQDAILADENAKRAIIEGEIVVNEWVSRPTPLIEPVSNPTDPDQVVWSRNLIDYKLAHQTDPVSLQALTWYEQLEPWWDEFGFEAFGTSAIAVNGRLKSSPKYVIEEYFIEDSGTDLSQSGQYYAGQVVVYYRITARATGDRDGRATLQSTFARTFN